MKKHCCKWILLYICLVFLYSLNAFSENMSGRWASISLVYYQDFPAKTINSNIHVHGCVLKAGAEGDGSMRWHCQEKVYLLRPLSQVALLQQKPYRFPSDATVSDFNHANVQVTSVHLLKKAPILLDKGHIPVTGIFITHSLRVKKYRFKNIKTGHLSSIMATDNHPFYSEDSGTFVPVSSLSSSDHLINNKQETVQLLCTDGHTVDCGISASQLSPALVYNLETYKKHTFYAGHEQILVHNCSPLPLYDHSVQGGVSHRKLAAGDAARLLQNVQSKEIKSLNPQKVAYYFFHGAEKDSFDNFALIQRETVGGKAGGSSVAREISAEDVAKEIRRAPEFESAEAVFIINSAPRRMGSVAKSKGREYFQEIERLVGKRVLYNAENPLEIRSYPEGDGMTHVRGYYPLGKLSRRLECWKQFFGTDLLRTNWFRSNSFVTASTGL